MHVKYINDNIHMPFRPLPIGSMYGIYTNIGGILSILMGSMLPYIAYMDPMGYDYC